MGQRARRPRDARLVGEPLVTDTDQMVTWLRAAMDAAKHRAEEAAADTGSANWEYQPSGILDAMEPAGFMVATGSQDFLEPERGQFMAANDPAAVLRRIAADRQLLDDLIAEQHNVVEDPAYTCPAATTERDGGRNYHPGPCNCARDERVHRRVRLLAEGYGWTEEER
ncbi:DUF6221 family protein [Streptomyces sp. NPDC004232]|uniref:DUF6221 family protein n=1 Tax=Streptomyces sp. NPDC004232 TaxID=3154454 RepID=UPI0033A4DED8